MAMIDTLALIADALRFVGLVLITVYATHQAIILVFGRADDWMEALAGAGGLLFLLGVYLAGSRLLDDAYIIANGLQSVGVGLLLMPRVVRITLAALRPC